MGKGLSKKGKAPVSGHSGQQCTSGNESSAHRAAQCSVPGPSSPHRAALCSGPYSPSQSSPVEPCPTVEPSKQGESNFIPHRNNPCMSTSHPQICLTLEGDEKKCIESLRKHLPHMVKTLDIETVLELLRKYFIFSEQEQLDLAVGRAKVTKLCEIMERRLASNDFTLYKGFLSCLAGIDTEMFKSYTGRDPTIDEAMLCIEDRIQEQRNLIVNKGHIPDREDREINLEKNYVKLRLKQADLKGEMSYLSEDHPLAYQKYLTHREHRDNVDSPSVDMGEDIEDIIARDANTSKFYLIQGRCGIGKTTMVQHLSRRWGGEKCLSTYSHVIVIPIRRLVLFDHKLSLHELLTENCLYPCSIPRAWMENWQEYILVSLDGLDELTKFGNRLKHVREITDMTAKATPIELVLNLLKRNLLHRATLVSTSRPFEGLNGLACDVNLEVMGLTTEEVHLYIDKNICENDRETVHKTLRNNPILTSVCSITYYASVLCEDLARQAMQERDIATYTRLTAYLIMSYPRRALSTFAERMPCTRAFKVLSNIAYGALGNENLENNLTKICFDLEVIPQVHSEESIRYLQAAQKHGLVQITEVVMGTTRKDILEFTHLSIQEFFAALKCLQSPSEEQKHVLDGIFEEGRLNMLQLFLYGIAFDSGVDTELDRMRQHVFSSGDGPNTAYLKEEFQNMIDGEMSNDVILKLCQMAYEAQSETLSGKLSNAFVANSEFKLTQKSLNVLDVKGFLFVISKAGPRLKQLVLRHNRIGDEGAKAIADALTVNTTLTKVQLHANDIEDEGAKALAEALKVNKILTDIYLANNHIGDKGTAAVAWALRINTTLTTIDLGYNRVGDEGAKAIAEALKINVTLSCMFLRYNSIGEEGGKAIAEVLRVNKTLTYIDLGSNELGDEGAEAIAGALSENTTLTGIDMSSNMIEAKGGKAIANALRQNTTLTEIYLEFNDVGEEVNRVEKGNEHIRIKLFD